MIDPKTFVVRAAGGCVLAVVLSACVTTDLPEVLPPDVRDTFEVVSEQDSVAVRVVPRPEGEQLSINMGSLDYTLNRLFARMVTEMARTKFGTVDRGADNRIDVVVSYLNVDERRYAGGSYLQRLDMEVDVRVGRGETFTEQTLSRSVMSDLEGYSLRSDQIYGLLLGLVASIDGLVDEVMGAK